MPVAVKSTSDPLALPLGKAEGAILRTVDYRRGGSGCLVAVLSEDQTPDCKGEKESYYSDSSFSLEFLFAALQGCYFELQTNEAESKRSRP